MPNKNVDRINYIHYNVQRLANLTRDHPGISTQLAATSLMAFQNRVALDMLLAEKGGVCAMFGDQCCTFIPNITAPDGSVTKALNGLRALSTELKEASGLDNPLEAWMQGLFGRWKALVMAVLTSLACFLAILITCGCCCIPCARTLCVRLIATALSKENAPRDYDHQMVSLLVEPRQDDDDESYCDMTVY
ncbi:Syncytin-A [Merluccius polli]|uniref:Syncytin-A n=1 Tax=Merluccius polli TaxID=89951 RepID=A0AA47ME02_MERPO|nr:Syncytin-A [Merluccius polli]